MLPEIKERKTGKRRSLGRARLRHPIPGPPVAGDAPASVVGMVAWWQWRELCRASLQEILMICDYRARAVLDRPLGMSATGRVEWFGYSYWCRSWVALESTSCGDKSQWSDDRPEEVVVQCLLWDHTIVRGTETETRLSLFPEAAVFSIRCMQQKQSDIQDTPFSWTNLEMPWWCESRINEG